MVTVTEPLAITCPACGRSRSFVAGAPSRFPRRCPDCGAELFPDGRAAEPRSRSAALLPAPTGAQAVGVAAFAALLAASQLRHGAFAGIVSAADLVFHEAGHPILGVFGSRLLMFLGGTIVQLAMPVAAAVAFARRRRTAALAVALVWVAFNLVEVGAYAADARDRALPLLAEGRDAHDGWNVLGMLGLRERCRGIGGTIAAAGWALWAAAPAWVGWRWLRARRVPR